MIIGYDLDGTLCDFNESVYWHVLQAIPLERRMAAHNNYFRSRKPLLNPELFCSKEDEYHVITARYDDFKSVTEEWCQKFLPNVKSVNTSGIWTPWGDKGIKMVEKPNHKQIKADIIRKLGVEVYFEDSPNYVEYLRKELPDVKIIHYGGLTQTNRYYIDSKKDEKTK